MSHLSEEELILLYYGETEPDSDSGIHLAACSQCGHAYRELRKTLDLVETPAVPDRGPSYGAEVWARLQPRLRPKSRWHLLFQWPLAPIPLKLAGLAALLTLAFFLGMWWRSDTQPIPIAPVQQRILNQTVGDHLERTRQFLTEINREHGEDPADHRTWARRLADDNRLLRQVANRQGQTTLADLLDQLELALVEAAHRAQTQNQDEDPITAGEIADLLFRIRLMAEKLTPQSDSPPAPESIQI